MSEPSHVKVAAKSSCIAPPHCKSSRKCKALVKCKSPLLPHQGLMWRFPIGIYFGGHPWVIHAEQLFSCCYSSSQDFVWNMGFGWGVLSGKERFEVWVCCPYCRSQKLVLFLFYTGCLILLFFVGTAGLVTAPGEIKLTGPICTHKINKSGLWV